MKIYRQGDVRISSVEELPEGLKLKKDTVLVYGESTGHSHRLQGGKVYTKGDEMYIVCNDGDKIVHEEHETINLAKGRYAVIRQKEYLTKDMSKVVVD